MLSPRRGPDGPWAEGGESGLRRERAPTVRMGQHRISGNPCCAEKACGHADRSESPAGGYSDWAGHNHPGSLQRDRSLGADLLSLASAVWGMTSEMVEELRGLQKENARVRKVAAGLVLNNKTMWLRASLETCTTRCPEDVEVAKIIDAVKVTAVHQRSRSLCRGLPGSSGRSV